LRQKYSKQHEAFYEKRTAPVMFLAGAGYLHLQHEQTRYLHWRFIY
jgi:hypothetical protein